MRKTKEQKEHEKLTQQIVDLMMMNHTCATRMYELFDKCHDDIWKYIKVGRTFWKYNDDLQKFELIRITYKRSGIAFYVVDERLQDGEDFLVQGSMGPDFLYPRYIVIKEIVDHCVKQGYYGEDSTRADIYKSVKRMFETMEMDIPGPEVKIEIKK